MAGRSRPHHTFCTGHTCSPNLVVYREFPFHCPHPPDLYLLDPAASCPEGSDGQREGEAQASMSPLGTPVPPLRESRRLGEGELSPFHGCVRAPCAQTPGGVGAPGSCPASTPGRGPLSLTCPLDATYFCVLSAQPPSSQSERAEFICFWLKCSQARSRPASSSTVSHRGARETVAPDR